MPTQWDALDNGNIAMSACACICSLYYNKHRNIGLYSNPSVPAKIIHFQYFASCKWKWYSWWTTGLKLTFCLNFATQSYIMVLVQRALFLSPVIDPTQQHKMQSLHVFSFSYNFIWVTHDIKYLQYWEFLLPSVHHQLWIHCTAPLSHSTWLQQWTWKLRSGLPHSSEQDQHLWG